MSVIFQPTVDRVTTRCAEQNSGNYINDCDYESAYDMLSYIYDGGLLVGNTLRI